MEVVVIAYQVKDATRVTRLRSAIRRRFETFANDDLPFCIIGTDLAPGEIRDQLTPILGDGDSLYIGIIEKSAWSGIPRLKDWLSETRSA